MAANRLGSGGASCHPFPQRDYDHPMLRFKGERHRYRAVPAKPEMLKAPGLLFRGDQLRTRRHGRTVQQLHLVQLAIAEVMEGSGAIWIGTFGKHRFPRPWSREAWSSRRAVGPSLLWVSYDKIDAGILDIVPVEIVIFLVVTDLKKSPKRNLHSRAGKTWNSPGL
jgi:hypothetical protein